LLPTLANGHVDFVVKVYFPNERFPEGGKVSQHMHGLKVGRCTS
jgi:cytochrome-b5 reductase